MIPGKTYRPDDVIAIAWQRKWTIVVPFLLVALAAIGVAWTLPDRYQSDTLILVVPQRVPESYVRSTVTARIEDRLQSISQQILSRTRLERIVQDADLYPELRRTSTMEDVVDRMRRDIDVQMVKADAFRVSYVSATPDGAMQVTQRLASLFIDENLKDREMLADGTNQFLTTQLEDARRRLIADEKKIETYRREHAGELPTQVTSNLQAMSAVQMQLQATVDSLNRDRDRRLILERMLADLTMPQPDADAAPAQAPAAAVTGSLDQPLGPGATTAERLEAARRLLADLQVRLKPVHPDIARARRTVADLEAKAAADTSRSMTDATGTASASVPGTPRAATTAAAQTAVDLARRRRSVRDEMESVDRQLAAKEAEQNRLKGVIADYQRRLDATPTRESEYTELTRDYTTLQALYTSLLSKNEEAKISANLERRQIGEQFKVLDPARLPEKPFSPNRLRIVAGGVLAGVALGIGLVALLEYRDTSLKTDEDVMTALALPALALIPIMRSAGELRRQRRHRLALSLTGIATVAVSAAAAFAMWKLKS
jgi:polysaccharide chain length determinant protein (PEP-CTERM system associated)